MGWHTGNFLQELPDWAGNRTSAGVNTGLPRQKEAGKEQPERLSPRTAWFPPSGKQLLD